jgi:hypothetical protein
MGGKDKVNELDCLHKKLNEYLEYFVKYLPKDQISRLIYEHFIDRAFYSIIKKEKYKAEQFVKNLEN